MTFLWCLDCGQSAPEDDAFGACPFCNAKVARLVRMDRPIEPAVIDGKPVAYTPLARKPLPHPTHHVICAPKRKDPTVTYDPEREPAPRAEPLLRRATTCQFVMDDGTLCGDTALPRMSWCAVHYAVVGR